VDDGGRSSCVGWMRMGVAVSMRVRRIRRKKEVKKGKPMADGEE